jgi:type IV secretory pathway TraG/TraD family ATPase VirD4
MTNREAMRWVTRDLTSPPAPDDASSSSPPAPNSSAATSTGPGPSEFSPDEFVRTTGTLYSLSKEGRGSAGPLVTALTVAICEAAEEHAKRSPGGRLPIPMVAVLDEAANVCRWRELPNLYSHYGSRGICMMTILQSWSQGVEVWGRDGMRKLWSAANIKIYGGGVSEAEFLSELSQLIGDFDLSTTSVSHSRGGRSTNRAVRRERILDIAELSALPKGRAIVLASGAPAALARTLPWMTGPHADLVRASIAQHDPVADTTIAEAMQSLPDGQVHDADDQAA